MLGELNPCGGGDPIPLLGRKLMVGRRPSCDIVLPFPNVSSHHCELEFREGYWHVKDLGSSNGIKVNGERCQTKCLYPGDELAIGKHAFKLDYKVTGVGVAGGPDEAEAEEPSTMSMSLLEKAGLEAERAASRLSPEAAREKRRRKQPRRAAAEDEFLMEWFPDQ